MKAVLDRLNASKGSRGISGRRNLPVGDTATTRPQTLANANQILAAAAPGRLVRRLCPPIFGSLDRRGRRRPRLGSARAAARAARRGGPADGPGQISQPIAVPGGFSIIAVQDTRKILTADPRDAVLSLKQVSITFPAGTTRQQAEPIVARFAQAAQNIGGCGGAERIAAEFNGEVVRTTRSSLRDLPPALQEMMLPMQVGQATRPFGSIEEGVRILVLCGRDEARSDGSNLRPGL